MGLLDAVTDDEDLKRKIKIFYDDVLYLVFIGLLLWNGLHLRECSHYCKNVGIDQTVVNPNLTQDNLSNFTNFSKYELKPKGKGVKYKKLGFLVKTGEKNAKIRS